ncbi:GAF and ANTAR domain-containing protein [Kineococcus sp. SYSU DK003]|uniref:GAF and ANTAR domain-containing protein n=1 Tax=Kineococcus sp. SYSU DK003 TaxID=3383124 RepID=UPI003D7DF610
MPRLSVVRDPDEPLVVGGKSSLAADLAALARDLQQERRPQDVMQQIAVSAVAMVGADHASISLVRRHREVWSAAVTDEVARTFDASQEELGEGPCLDAMYSEQVVRSEDLSGDPRWPVLATRSVQLGVRSLLCFQLFVHRGTLGGLNLFAARAGAFDEEAELVGAAVAAHAAVALADTQQFSDLTTALTTRDVIGQAKGILMERFKIDADQAFALLTRISQNRNVKLHDLAEELVRTGTLDTGR